MKKFNIIVPRDGIASGQQQVRAIYSGDAAKILGAIGKLSTIRASNVEPGKALSQAALLALNQCNAQLIPPAVIEGDDGTGYKIHPIYEECWFADMTPCGHAVVLGPYGSDERDTALADEVEWLKAHNMPVCTDCRK